MKQFIFCEFILKLFFLFYLPLIEFELNIYSNKNIQKN